MDAMVGCRRVKHTVCGSRHPRNIRDMQGTAGEHFRATRHCLDNFAYMGRRDVNCCS